ncbi:unannotated protein [freshwater metagenome]|uniref:Unannotated protein n=1 Tax=freshwater metagenome TaxID=449393 RepID=A0A6J7C556_9ZZZZ
MVGLVEDGDLDAVEAAVALTDEVFEAARAGDDDVDAGLQCGGLVAEADAAVDDGVAQTHGLGQGSDGGRDLVGQFAGGHEDQTAGRTLTGALIALGERRDQRDGEGDGLAATGLAATQQVATCQRVGEGDGLDGERGGDATGGKGCDDGRGDTEGRERTRRLKV